MSKEKVVKARVSDEQHKLYKYIAKLRNKTETDIIHEAFEQERLEVCAWLRQEKHYSIYCMLTDIILHQNKNGFMSIYEVFEKSFIDSVSCLRPTQNTDPFKTEAKIPGIVAELEMILEKEIEGEKVYNILDEKLAEWDQVKKDWNL